MSETACGTARDLMPDYVAGSATADRAAWLVAHVAGCEECRAELALVQALRASRPVAPAGLAERVTHAVVRRRPAARHPWWGLSAAAIAAIAIGIGVASKHLTGDAAIPGFAYETDEGGLWLGDDGLVAGAPVLDGLSDEALGQLLDELSASGSGGAA